jgi:hypothetical protein
MSIVPTHSRKRFLVIGAAGALIGAVVLIACRSGPKEPEYQGKKLGEWCDIRTPADREGAITAWKALGTNSLPWAVKWLVYERPEWQYKIIRTGTKLIPRIWQKWFGFYGDKKATLMMGSMQIFETLGTNAAPAIPELVAFMKTGSSNTAQCAALALAWIGEPAVPAVIDVLTNRAAYVLRPDSLRMTVIRPLDNGNLLVPLIVSCIRNGEHHVGTLVEMLVVLQPKSELALPALVDLTKHPEACYLAVDAIGRLGTNAIGAKGGLRELLKSADSRLSESARAALASIVPEPAQDGVH